MVKACRKASKPLIRDFGEVEKLQVSLKGPGDFVTNSDKKVEKILIDELPVIPLYTYTRTYLLSERVKNWQNNILDTNPYQFLSLE